MILMIRVFQFKNKVAKIISVIFYLYTLIDRLDEAHSLYLLMLLVLVKSDLKLEQNKILLKAFQSPDIALNFFQ